MEKKHTLNISRIERKLMALATWTLISGGFIFYRLYEVTKSIKNGNKLNKWLFVPVSNIVLVSTYLAFLLNEKKSMFSLG